MTAKQAYRLSRIQAEGWKAARTLPSGGPSELTSDEIAARNPYPADPERTRWQTGFTSAL